MSEVFVVFSNNLEDLNFVRTKSNILFLFAADISILQQMAARFSDFTVFAYSNCIDSEFISLADRNIFCYSEYRNHSELESLVFRLNSSYEKENSDNAYIENYKNFCELSPAFALLAGSSPAMQKLRKTIIQIAPFDVSVLILGETGTGKTTVARAIHELSNRRKKCFKSEVLSNSNETLIESKLFGVSEGGFTGAVPGKGLFEECEGGTLFFDEIGELSMNIQTKLLQVLSEGVINRIGSNKDIPVDNRMIFATNANLDAKIKAKEFREDLFYRINDVIIKIPPLRERLEDIPDLCQMFLKREKLNKTISKSALMFLQTFPWKGNIRQLEKCIKKAALLYCHGDVIEPDHLKLLHF